MTQTAQIYGESLYELARDEGLGEEIFHQLQMVSALFRENPQYAELLAMPSLPKRERCGVLNQAFQNRVHPYLLNFLKILVEHGTIRQLSGCEAVYRQGYYEDNGILEVTAVTAVPLSEPMREKLSARLADKTGKTILLQTQVDPNVLGGVRLEIADKRLDGTIRSRLDKIQASLRSKVL